MLSSRRAGPMRCVCFAQTPGRRSWGKPKTFSPYLVSMHRFFWMPLVLLSLGIEDPLRDWYVQCLPMFLGRVVAGVFTEMRTYCQWGVRCSKGDTVLAWLSTHPPSHSAGLNLWYNLRSLTLECMSMTQEVLPPNFTYSPHRQWDLTDRFYLSSVLQNWLNFVSLQCSCFILSTSSLQQEQGLRGSEQGVWAQELPVDAKTTKGFVLAALC